MFASNIRREVCNILDGFLSLFKKYEGNKKHKMLSPMLDLRFKVWGWFHLLLIESKLLSLWKSITKDLYFLCFWNAMTSSTLWQNLDLWQICKLMKKVAWTFLRCLLAPPSQQKRRWTRIWWCLKGLKWMSRTLNILYNVGWNTSLYFQLWHFLFVRFLALLVLKHDLK